MRQIIENVIIERSPQRTIAENSDAGQFTHRRLEYAEHRGHACIGSTSRSSHWQESISRSRGSKMNSSWSRTSPDSFFGTQTSGIYFYDDENQAWDKGGREVSRTISPSECKRRLGFPVGWTNPESTGGTAPPGLPY